MWRLLQKTKIEDGQDCLEIGKKNKWAVKAGYRRILADMGGNLDQKWSFSKWQVKPVGVIIMQIGVCHKFRIADNAILPEKKYFTSFKQRFDFHFQTSSLSSWWNWNYRQNLAFMDDEIFFNISLGNTRGHNRIFRLQIPKFPRFLITRSLEISSAWSKTVISYTIHR